MLGLLFTEYIPHIKPLQMHHTPWKAVLNFGPTGERSQLPLSFQKCCVEILAALQWLHLFSHRLGRGQLRFLRSPFIAQTAYWSLPGWTLKGIQTSAVPGCPLKLPCTASQGTLTHHLPPWWVCKMLLYLRVFALWDRVHIWHHQLSKILTLDFKH